MDKASEYRQRARECRELAQQMPNAEQRAQLLSMAEMWDNLAEDRGEMIGRHPELAKRMDEED
jgi:hypothetical protein